jgi:hypothetical protein
VPSRYIARQALSIKLRLIYQYPMIRPAQTAVSQVAVQSLGHARFGTWVLFVAATGFAAYDLHSLALARYSRM